MANSGNTNNNEDALLNEVHKKVSVLSAEDWGADASKKVETKYNIHIKCDNDCAMIYSVSGNHFNKPES